MPEAQTIGQPVVETPTDISPSAEVTSYAAKVGGEATVAPKPDLLTDIARRVESGEEASDLLNKIAESGPAGLTQDNVMSMVPGSGVSAFEEPVSPPPITEVKPIAPVAEPTLPAAEVTPESSTPSAESTAPTEEKSKMAEIEAKLSELGMDSEEGKDVIKALSENPDLIDAYKDKIDNAKAAGEKYMELAKSLGYTLPDADSTKFALGLIIGNINRDVSKLAEESSSDPARAEEIRQKNLLARILIATMKGLGRATIGIATGTGVAVVAGGAAALGAAAGKH